MAVTSDLGSLAARLGEMAAAVPAQLAAGMVTLAEEAGTILVPSIAEHTPVGPGNGPHLWETTTAEPLELTTNTAGLAVRQTKRVGRKQWMLARLLGEGHRIVTRGGRDTGRTTEPMPYVDDALAESLPAIELALIDGSRQLAENICAVLR